MLGPQKHDCAVAFCVDRNFFPLSLFMIWQTAHLNPKRQFDFVISTQDELAIPDWAKPLGIVLHRTGNLPAYAEAARFNGSLSTLFRLTLARELGGRYRRIIYMDSDMYVAGGDLGRLMDIDLGPHPIGAALDFPHFVRAEPHDEEFVTAGVPPLPYFNGGFQVIDTNAYQEQEVERRSFEVCKTYPGKIMKGDQTLCNIALRGKFAQLAPCWNWQLDFMYPSFAHFYPVFNYHFITQNKPDRSSNSRLPARFNQAYRDFFTQFLPDLVAELAPAPTPRQFTFRQQTRMVLDTLLAGHITNAVIARFPDPYRATL